MSTCQTKSCYTTDTMCGRFGISLERERIEQRFGVTFAAAAFTPRYNAAPSQALPVSLNEEPKTIQFLTWGLRPAWMTKVPKKGGCPSSCGEKRNGSGSRA